MPRLEWTANHYKGTAKCLNHTTGHGLEAKGHYIYEATDPKSHAILRKYEGPCEGNGVSELVPK